MATGMESGMSSGLHWGVEVVVLFEAWHVHSAAWYIAALVGVFLVAAGREWLLTVHRRSESREAALRDQTDDHEANTLQDIEQPHSEASERRRAVKYHLFNALFRVLLMATTYALMLLVMTYNLGLGLAVLAGEGMGYFLFHRPRHSDAEAAHAGH